MLEAAQALLRRLEEGEECSPDEIRVVIYWLLAAIGRRDSRIEFLRELAYTDPLTGLWTRRGYEELMAHPEFARKNLFTLLFDIDGFKEFNDEFGRMKGDLL